MNRVVVAAPASGSGKTTVATGLLGALRRRGTTVAPFKVGPDYIDPGYHALAAGRPGRNLDPVLVGEQRIAPLFSHGAAGADLAVVEGVMGLFDGQGTGSLGSTAHVARLLDAPVVLVVDATGQGRSLAALLHGFRSFDDSVRFAGVILNRVGSARHAEVLGEACAEVGLPVLGVLPRDATTGVPCRHLGLVTAAEHADAAVSAVDSMVDLVEANVRLDELCAAAAAPPLPGVAWDPSSEMEGYGGPRGVVAVAGGPAFTFGYAEHAELLAAAGAEVAVLDPLRDEALPEHTRGLVLPGGFPEVHAAELYANGALREAVAGFAAAGHPVHAECGGLLYLARQLDGHPMCGTLDVLAEMSPRLRLGYRHAVAATASHLYAEGERVAGHEFHRTTVDPPHGALPAWQWREHEGTVRKEGFVFGGVHASYLHTHPAGNPGAVGEFVRACVTAGAAR
ncbi:MAG: cobyrinate a,c-diamide synthase [Sciscionella sp.]